MTQTEYVQNARTELENAIAQMVIEFEADWEMEVFSVHIRPNTFENRIAVAVKLPDTREAKLKEAAHA